jgi:indolepyruvate ferredoxin oxidoreductase alpha subunit
MTGLQPHPGIGIDARGNKTKIISIEDIVKACNVDYLAIIDPFKVNKAKKILVRALKMHGQRVVISRQACAQVLRKINKENEKIKTYKIESRRCKKCKLCILSIGCPAILVRNNLIVINKYFCSGCGLCSQVCPYGAIIPDREK